MYRNTYMPSCKNNLVLIFLYVFFSHSSLLLGNYNGTEKHIEGLSSAIDSLNADGYFHEAIELYNHSLSTLSKDQNNESIHWIELNNRIAESYFRIYQYKTCDSILQTNIDINLQRSIPDTYEIAFSKHLQTRSYFANHLRAIDEKKDSVAIINFDDILDLLNKSKTRKNQELSLTVIHSKCTIYARVNKFSDCLSCIESHRRTIDSLDFNLPLLEASFESLLGYVLFMTGKAELAENHLKKSINLYKKHQGEFAFYLFYPLKNYSKLLIRQAKFKHGIAFKEEAINIYQHRGFFGNAFLIREKLNLADIYVMTKYEDKAIDLVMQVMPYLERAQESFLYTFAKYILGRAYLKQQKFIEAESILLDVIQNGNFDPESMYFNSAQHNLSQSYYHQKNYPKCIEIVDELLDKSCDLASSNEYVQYGVLAAIESGNWVKAEEYNLRNEEEIVNEELKFSESTKVIKLHAVLNFYYHRYKQFYSADDLQKLVELTRRLIKNDQMVNADFYDFESQSYYHNNMGERHDLYLEAFYLAYQHTKNQDFLVEASQFVDYQKSSAIRAKFHMEKVMDRNTLLEIESIEKKINLIYDVLPFASDEEAEEIQSKLFNHKAHIAELKENDNQQDRDLFVSKLSFKEILQESIKDSTAILQVYFGMSKVHLFLHDNYKTQYHSFNSDYDFVNNLDRLITKVQKGENNSIDSLSLNLYNKIFENFDIQNETRNLTIIPDGKLSFLPFDLLQYQNKKYLLERFNIQTSNSIQVLYNQKSKKTKNTIKALCFSPSYDVPENVDLLDEQMAILVRGGYFNLPGAIEESEKIHAFLGGKKFTYENAQESTFKKFAKDYNVIHLAMHGLIDESDIMRSKLLFSNKIENEKDDNYLHAYEIMNMDLDANLVVLSACNTGLGELRHGLGVQSLANAFIYAGVSNTVMSLWKVPDSSTSILMENFYRNLKEGQAIHRALKNAKLEYLSDESISQKLKHPYYWAGFIANGNMRPLKDSSIFVSANFISSIGISLFLLLLLILSNNIRKNKNLRLHK